MNILQQWRGRSGYNIKQSVLAREAGIHPISLSRIENGAEPTVTNALRICEALSRLAAQKGRGPELGAIPVEHVFFYSDEGEWSAWGAWQKAQDDLWKKADGSVHPSA